MLLAAGLLAACTADDGGSDVPDGGRGANGTQQTEITLHADVHRMVEGTRATTIDNATGLQAQDIRIDAYFHGTETAYLDGVKLHYDTDAWKFWAASAETHYYWPIEGSVYSGSTVSSLDFVGYCPFDLSNTCIALDTYNGTGLSLTCTGLPVVNTTPGEGQTTQANLKEFLWAYTTNKTKDDNPVTMSFAHPFARIKFHVSGSDVTVNSVTISDVKNNGTCTFDGSAITWTPSGDPANLVITGTPATGDTPYIVIPQTFASDLTFTVNASWNDWGDTPVEHTLSTTVSVSWQAGYSYTYTFNISPDDLTVNVTNFTEQW